MSQTTPYACPSCQKMLAVPNQHLGKQIRCPGCKNPFRTKAVAAQTPAVTAAPVLTDNDPFASDPLGNDPFSNNPLGSDPFQSPPTNDPFASTSAQPAYLSGGTKTAQRGNARRGKSSGKKRNTHPEMTEAEQRAFGSGIFLLVVPIVATVLPMMGLQLRRLAKLGDAAPLAGIVLGLVGAGFIAYARRNQKDKVLSPILAGVFSVIIGVVGFLLLTALHSESDLAGDQPAQGAMAPAADGPNGGFDHEFGGMAVDFDPANDPMGQQHDEAMQRHQQMVEDARRRSEEAMQEARDQHDKMRERMRKDMENGSGFMQNGGGLPGSGLRGGNGAPGGGFPPGNPFGGSGFGPPPGA